MDYKNRIWNRRSVYLTRESTKIIGNISHMLDKSKAYAINLLLQEAYEIVKTKIERGQIA